jgi:methylisocitrate lyase
MLFETTQPHEKRAKFRADLKSGRLLKFPGAFIPLMAMHFEKAGFDGVYVSGGAIAAALGLPDIGLTTLTEVAGIGNQIARVTALPTLIDADTGFGEAMSAARTIQSFEDAGISGCHIEDQIMPKRCGHLDNKSVVSTAEMVQRLRAAVTGRRDPNFIIIARTDSRASEGLDQAIDRMKAYIDAGADAIFPEAMKNEKEFEAVREALPGVPLLANMTEFGKSRLLTVTELESLGFNIVIWPVSSLRLAMKAVIDGFETLKAEGNLDSELPNMQTRADLYELLQYERYNEFDRNLFNFKVEGAFKSGN